MATAMKKVEEELADIEIAKMEREIAAQVRKYVEEQVMKKKAAAIKEKEYADEMEREMDAQVRRDTK